MPSVVRHNWDTSVALSGSRTKFHTISSKLIDIPVRFWSLAFRTVFFPIRVFDCVSSLLSLGKIFFLIARSQKLPPHRFYPLFLLGLVLNFSSAHTSANQSPRNCSYETLMSIKWPKSWMRMISKGWWSGENNSMEDWGWTLETIETKKMRHL